MLVLDRCHGGGSTAASGGVIYAGGGTPYQKADVDSPPRYTPPPWEAKEVSFVEMKNIFVRSKPDVDFLKDGAMVPLLLTS